MNDNTNPYETKAIAEVLSEFKVQESTGLSDDEVKQCQISIVNFNIFIKKFLTKKYT